jgi:RNA polymerase sigma-70 factor (ECF subfamily)
MVLSRTCRDIFLRLSEYLDGDLPAERCERIRRHLAVCPTCRAFTNTLRKTVELCRKLPPHPLPPDVRRTLRVIIRRRLAEGRTGIHRRGRH